MKTPRLLATVFFAFGLAVLGSGCATNSYSAVPIRRLQTYSIVAVDDQGIVSQSELDKIRDTLVQFLTDQGYVHDNQVLIADPVSADIVFRIKIAWPATGGSIAILGVAPSYGGGSVYAESPAYYAPVSPWTYDEWSYDPWWYSDHFGGYSYGPYCPFLTVFPFIPFYGFDHHRRPSPPFFHGFPSPEHRSQSWNRYSHYVPPWRPGGVTRPPLLPPRRSLPRSWADHSSGPPRSPAARRIDPVSAHRTSPSAVPAPRPRIPYSDQRRATDTAMAHPQSSSSRDRVGPPDSSAQTPRNWDSTGRRGSNATSSHPSSPASVDRPVTSRDYSARSPRTPDSDRRPSPDASPRRPDSVNHSPPSGGPQRQSAAPQYSSPQPQRENPSPRHDASPPARENSASARSYSPPPSRESSPSPAHSSSPSSSSSGSDSKSRSTDKDR